MQSHSSDSARWRAVQIRDKTAHSAFVYAVLTTKIVCRPTCPSRLARRSNVKYYDTVTEALLDGFRACKRCQPELPDELEHDDAATTVANACRLIENANGDIKLTELGVATGFSTRHLHNLFKAKLGCTPAIYAAHVRQIRTWRGSTSTSPSPSTRTPMNVDLLCGPGYEKQPKSLDGSSIDPLEPLEVDAQIDPRFSAEVYLCEVFSTTLENASM